MISTMFACSAPAGGLGHNSTISPGTVEPGGAIAPTPKPIAEAPANARGDLTKARRESFMEKSFIASRNGRPRLPWIVCRLL